MVLDVTDRESKPPSSSWRDGGQRVQQSHRVRPAADRRQQRGFGRDVALVTQRRRHLFDEPVMCGDDAVNAHGQMITRRRSTMMM